VIPVLDMHFPGKIGVLIELSFLACAKGGVGTCRSTPVICSRRY